MLKAILVAVSLCADCFAVSLCSSVTLKKVNWRQIALVSLSFAVIQSMLLAAGWLFGSLLVGFLSKISHWIGFLLLLYVGGSMLVEGIKGEAEVKDLNGFRNIIIGGIATSIDALGVGVSMSMDSQPWSEFSPLLLSVFTVTAISVIAGILGGKAIGRRCGRIAEILGGIVLIGIGIGFLI